MDTQRILRKNHGKECATYQDLNSLRIVWFLAVVKEGEVERNEMEEEVEGDTKRLVIGTYA